jgi:hypothetical protein
LVFKKYDSIRFSYFSLLGLHFMTSGCQKWFKYVEVNPLDSTRYFHELAEKFESPVRTAIYCVSFVFCLYTCCMVSILQCSQLVSIINIRKHYTNWICLCNCDSSWIHFHCIISSFQSLIFNYNGIRLKIPNGPISDKWTNYKIIILLTLLTNETLMLSLLGQVSWRFCFRNISRIRI